jgi:serine/threonine protein kinase
MSVHDSRTAGAAAGRQNHEESVDETSTIFEWRARQQAARNGESLTRTASFFEQPARQRAARNDGDNLIRTASFFEQHARQRTARNDGDNLDKTSMIFERPARQQPAENEEDRLNPRPALQSTDDKTKHHELFETGANVSHERRLNERQAGFALLPQRSNIGGQLEPERDGLHMSSTAAAQLIGRTLANKYTIESVIGTGSMGTIYRARQIALDKWVAVKILHRELAEQRNFVERFKLEAFSASRLEHPNSLRVLDFGEDGNLLHLVMEYVEADDLLTVMQREWPFKDVRIVQIMSQALAALAKAHEVGIVHRDIKPENILILRGTDDEGTPTDIVKVCDFGIAKMAGPSAPQHPFTPHLTTEGLVVGTPDYMSPEQARGEGVDGRSDLYSMGVVLYHLLCGRPPFIADTPVGIAIQHVAEPPPPPSRHGAVNPVLESICLRALNKRPEDRFQTAREMRRAILSSLAPSAEGGVTSARRTATPILSFPPFWESPASTALQVRQSTEPRTPRERNGSWHRAVAGSVAWIWAWLREGSLWLRSRARRRPIVAAAALVTVASLALSLVISRRRSEEASWGNGNVVRSATVALAPGPQANPASSEGSNLGPTQPHPRQTPRVIPDDTDPPVAAPEPELRGRPATAPPPAPRH